MLILTKAGGDHDPVPAANPHPISPENKILKRIFFYSKGFSIRCKETKLLTCN